MYEAPLIIKAYLTYFTDNALPVYRRSRTATKLPVTNFDDGKGAINGLLTAVNRTSVEKSLSDCSDNRIAVKWAGTTQRTSDKEVL